MSGGRMSCGRLSGGRMSGGLMSVHLLIRARRYVNQAGRKGIRAGRKTVRAGCSTLRNMPSWKTLAKKRVKHSIEFFCRVNPLTTTAANYELSL